jgi:PAS domain S-box-containing protein
MILASVRDITERKQTEEALKQSGELYRTVIEQAAESIFLVDVESKRILEVNASLARVLGYAPDELKEITLYDVVADDRESVDSNIRRILRQKRYSIGGRKYRRKDGSLVDVEVNVSVVPYGGKETMCIVAHDVTSHKQVEKDLRRSLSILLALREAGEVLSSTLESEEIVTRLLEIMQGVSGLTAAVISLRPPSAPGNFRIWRSVGLEALWPGVRFAPGAEDARRAALEDQEQRLVRLRRPGVAEDESLEALYLPLKVKDRVVGVMEAYGPESLARTDVAEVLRSLTSQAASALENAQLYEELAERERALQDLVGKLMGAQEEERRRVAYEVHDSLAQVAVAAHQHLQAFARRHSPDAERGRRDLERILELVRGTVSDARRIIANLRPTTLDDLGLAATISLEVERLREEGYRVDYTDDIGEERLAGAVEIAFFRVAQEALTNMRKHARTRWVRIELRREAEEVRLEIEDDGRGFDPAAASLGSGPGERVGLAGMRERIGALGGTLEVRSSRGAGTFVAASVPLTRAH